MQLLNDDFKHIIKIFENAIIPELKVIQQNAEEIKDKTILNQTNDLLQSENLLEKIIELIDNDSFFNDLLPFDEDDIDEAYIDELDAETDQYENEANKSDIKKANSTAKNRTNKKKILEKYSIAKASASFICDLIDEFNVFYKALNKDENETITVREATDYIAAMNAIDSFVKRSVLEYGISLLNAAECYQNIMHPEVTLSELSNLKNACKARWKNHFKLKPISKGKHGAKLYKLEEMAEFVHKHEGHISKSKLLNDLKKYKEDI